MAIGFLLFLSLQKIPYLRNFVKGFLGLAFLVGKVRQVLAANPDQFKATTYLGEILYYEGKFAEGERVLTRANELSHGSGDSTPALMSGMLYASRGERNKIDPQLLKLQPAEVIDGDVAYWVAGIYCMLGEKERALLWLRRTVELGNHNYPWFQRDKNFEKLRADPDYRRIMDEVRGHWEEYRARFAA